MKKCLIVLIGILIVGCASGPKAPTEQELMDRTLLEKYKPISEEYLPQLRVLRFHLTEGSRLYEAYDAKKRVEGKMNPDLRRQAIEHLGQAREIIAFLLRKYPHHYLLADRSDRTERYIRELGRDYRD